MTEQRATCHSDKECTIYGLVDPEGKVFYVGKTIRSLKIRLREHITHARRYPNKTAKNRAIFEILESDDRPSIIALEKCLEKHASSRERAQASRFSDLANTSTPGSGGSSLPKEVFSVWEPLLGKMYDREIAEKFGVSPDNVRYRRRKLGIAAKPAPKPESTPGGHNRLNLPDWTICQLGRISDKKLAKQVGCDPSVVSRHRKERGIASYAEQTGDYGRIQCGSEFVIKHRWSKR